MIEHERAFIGAELPVQLLQYCTDPFRSTPTSRKGHTQQHLFADNGHGHRVAALSPRPLINCEGLSSCLSRGLRFLLQKDTEASCCTCKWCPSCLASRAR